MRHLEPVYKGSKWEANLTMILLSFSAGWGGRGLEVVGALSDGTVGQGARTYPGLDRSFGGVWWNLGMGLVVRAVVPAGMVLG